MKKMLWVSFVYVVFVLIVSLVGAMLVIPTLQGFGMSDRDVIGMSLVIYLVSVGAFGVLGLLIWGEVS